MERLDNFNKRMDEFQAKVNEMAEARETKIDMEHALIDNKIHTAQDKRDARIADLNTKKANVKDSITGYFDNAKSKIEAKKDARDQKKLEKYIDDQIEYAADCIAVALMALDEAQIAFLQAVEAAKEYDEKYGN
jgi:hypothetical protein